MAAIPVTSANTNNQINGSRVSVRNSAGVPYVVVLDETDGGIEVWKGNSTTPTAFTEQDTANNPQSAGYGSMSVAIDSSDILHISYMYDNGKASQLRYITFNADGATDTFSGDVAIIADIGEDPLAITNLYTAIAIDSNNIPHIAYNENIKIGGNTTLTLMYANKVGGSWNTSVQVEYVAGNDIQSPDIAIDADNLPVIAYYNTTDDDVGTAIGNVNNATSFTLFDISSGTTSYTQGGISIAVDSSGNHWVAYRSDAGSNDIALRSHTYGNSWSTWGTEIASGEGFGIVPISLVIDGIDKYVFFENNDSDIAYLKYDGSWSALTILETGTFNTAKAKWGFWVDNDSQGNLIADLSDSYSESNSDNSNASIYGTRIQGQSFTANVNGDKIDSVIFDMSNFGSPSGDVVVEIYAHTGTFGSTGTPTGSVLATSNPVNASTFSESPVSSLVKFKFTGANRAALTASVNYFAVVRFTNGEASSYVLMRGDATSPTHGGNIAWNLSGSWDAQAGRDAAFYVYQISSPSNRLTAIELDYTFTDETASPDVQWNTLTLGGGTVTTDQTVSARARIKDVDLTQTSSARARIKDTDLTKTVSARAKIVITTTQTVSSQARIKDTSLTQTVDSRASIKQTDITETVQARARVKFTDVTKTVSVRARLENTETQTVSSRARVHVEATETISAKAAIFKEQFQTVSARAKLVNTLSQTVSAKANIEKTGVTKTIDARGRIKSATTQTVEARAAVEKVGVTKTVDSKAKIVNTNMQTVDAKAAVEKTITQTIQTKARVETTETQTVEARARLEKTSTQTTAARARVEKVDNDKTIQAKSRVKVLSNDKTVQAKASVFQTTTATISARASIAIGTLGQTIDSKARLEKTETQTVSSGARVKQSADETVESRARISVSGVTKTVDAKAVIFKTETRTVLAKAQIDGENAQTVEARARLKQEEIQTITARAALELNVDRTVSVKASILHADVTKTVSVKARIETLSEYSVSSKARLSTTEEKTVQSRARVNIVSEQTAQAKADIEQTDVTKTVSAKARIDTGGVAKTIQARARIELLNTATVQVRARVLVERTKTISAKAFIAADAVIKTAQAKARVKVISIDNTVDTKARIKSSLDSTIQAKGTITVSGVTKTIQSKARLVAIAEQDISAKASVLSLGITKTVSARAWMASTTMKNVSSKARIKQQEIGVIAGHDNNTLISIGTKTRANKGHSRNAGILMGVKL